MFTTTPISITIAIRAIIERALPVKISESTTPIAPIGIVVMMMNGWAKLSRSAISKM